MECHERPSKAQDHEIHRSCALRARLSVLFGCHAQFVVRSGALNAIQTTVRQSAIGDGCIGI